MFDPYMRRANRAKTIRLLLTAFIFLAVAGIAAFVGVLVASPRYVAPAPATHLLPYHFTTGRAEAGPVEPTSTGSPWPVTDCSKAVQWMQTWACAKARHQAAAPGPIQSATP
jgi:hypothetical protein